jgi:formylglycine-generating enzyme required for sulfatase activity
MAKLRELLRILRDLGIVIAVVVVLWKVATGDGNSGRPEPASMQVMRITVMTNSLGMTLARIPAGEFLMGSSSYSRETTVHQVRLGADFWIGRNEVTQDEYRQVMGISPTGFQGDARPVEQVSWEDAAEFCRRLGAREQKTYRLPTEAEWEYTCRAGSRAAFCYGDDDTRLGEFAWYDASAGAKTHPVGSRKPNAWGIYDMHGNVWEWCQDWDGDDFYSTGPGTDPKGPSTGEYRVLRGGCWYNRPVFCRSARRDSNRPDYRDDGIGFRVVLQVGDAAK